MKFCCHSSNPTFTVKEEDLLAASVKKSLWTGLQTNLWIILVGIKLNMNNFEISDYSLTLHLCYTTKVEHKDFGAKKLILFSFYFCIPTVAYIRSPFYFLKKYTQKWKNTRPLFIVQHSGCNFYCSLDWRSLHLLYYCKIQRVCKKLFSKYLLFLANKAIVLNFNFCFL